MYILRKPLPHSNCPSPLTSPLLSRATGVRIQKVNGQTHFHPLVDPPSPLGWLVLNENPLSSAPTYYASHFPHSNRPSPLKEPPLSHATGVRIQKVNGQTHFHPLVDPPSPLGWLDLDENPLSSAPTYYASHFPHSNCPSPLKEPPLSQATGVRIQKVNGLVFFLPYMDRLYLTLTFCQDHIKF